MAYRKINGEVETSNISKEQWGGGDKWGRINGEVEISAVLKDQRGVGDK